MSARSSGISPSSAGMGGGMTCLGVASVDVSAAGSAGLSEFSALASVDESAAGLAGLSVCSARESGKDYSGLQFIPAFEHSNGMPSF